MRSVNVKTSAFTRRPHQKARHHENGDFRCLEESMRKSKLTANTSLASLGEGEAGLALVKVGRKHAISVATYHQWRRKYAGMSVNEIKRVKELETQNSCSQRTYAGLRNATLSARPARKHMNTSMACLYYFWT